jgi:plasmid stabilization system protein ParE
MQYRVKLTWRALRDLERIYAYIEAETSEVASRWFNKLTEAIYSLERLPERGSQVPESKKARQLLFGEAPHVYRILYDTDKRNRVVNVLHIRHAARARRSNR